MGAGIYEDVATSIESSIEEIPSALALVQNYPNPFNPSTAIMYMLPVSGHVRLAVYDMAGREIETLVDGWRPAGEHTENFSASGLATGTYVYRLTTSTQSLSRTMTIVR